MSKLMEEQIRPAEMMKDKQQCIDWDREFLLANRARWVSTNCPACDAAAFQEFGSKDGCTFVECTACQTIYTNPRPSVALLHDFYAKSKNYAYWNTHIFPATEAARREQIFRPRAKRLTQYCKRFGFTGGTLIEIGAAFGTFCAEIREHQVFDHVVALEATPALAQTCRDRGLKVMECFAEDVNDDGIADVVASFEVIEHLFSPGQFVRTCHRLLRPGGLLVLSCPNGRGFDVAALREASSTFGHEHLNYFNPASLAKLVERCGFATLDLETPGELDAELVRKQVVAGRYDVSDQPFLREVLLERWQELGGPFQRFLAAHRLSSHLWIVARKVESEA